MYKFGLFVFWFGSGLFMLEGLSLIVYQKGFSPIAWIFYTAKDRDHGVMDLSSVPYELTFVLGLFLILFPLWVWFRNDA